MRCIIDTDAFTLLSETSGRIPNLPFVDAKNAILGKRYNLSLVFPDAKKSTELHLDWKDEDGPANILSFPISKNAGEIFISLDAAKTECKKFGLDYKNYVGFLFIHGLLHLKGLDHGDIMEQAEKRFCKRFAIAFPDAYYSS